MCREFAAWLEALGARDERVVVLTGDLGFQALETVRARIGPRFVNVGVSEQNMVSMAASLASEGLRPFCYSSAPFSVFRPAEQIRLDVCIHGLEVKIIGNGGGYGHGIMGPTYHAIEDIGVLSTFPSMRCFVPVTGADVAVVGDAMMASGGPGYLRLNLGSLPPGFELDTPFAPVRRLRQPGASASPAVTVVGLGPVVLNALGAAVPKGSADFFVVSQVPMGPLPEALVSSVKRTGHVVVVEEHVERGGLAEHLALAMMREKLRPVIETRSAQGYPSKTYGSQAFHQRASGLDPQSLAGLVESVILGK